MAIRQKVLLVDSDREFCDFLSGLLSECGYEVLHAATGEEATRMANRKESHKIPCHCLPIRPSV